MAQKVTWPVMLVAAAAVLLLLVFLYRRSGLGGAQARVSPAFQQLSPEEQKRALFEAEMARRRRAGLSR
jgi:hypothetical protein